MSDLEDSLPDIFFEKELIEELKKCQITTIPGSSQLLNEDDYIQFVPLVLKGNIKVKRNDESGKEILLYNILGGESCVLSISSCLTNKRSKAIAETSEITEALIVKADQVRDWMIKYQSWREFVFELYHKRFNEMIQLFDALAFRKADQRLLDKIKELKVLQGSDTISVTHRELANELGTVREVISRLLKQLEKQGMIKNLRGKIKILRQL